MSQIQWKEVSCQYENMNLCWECVSHKSDVKGYPRHSKNGINTKVCRTMYENSYGMIPIGLVMRHKCDNPKCINPEHLEPGTSKENAHDRDIRGRSKRTNLNAELILAIRNDRRPYKHITQDYKIAASTISNIKSKFRWGWVV